MHISTYLSFAFTCRIMDGIEESSRCSDAAVCSASVSCVVALLGTLEDFSHGRGLSDEQVEALSNIKEAENWRELYGIKGDHGNMSRSPNLISGNLEDSEDSDMSDEDERKIKPKHIRWQMDYENTGSLD